MEVFVEFRDLEKIASIEEKIFLDTLSLKIDELGFDYGLRALIASGICVDNFGTEKHKALYKESINVFQKHCEENDSRILTLNNEVNIFDYLFSQFEQLRKKAKVDSIPLEMQIPAFLLTSEILLGSFSEYARGSSIEEISLRYPSIFGAFYETGNIAKPQDIYSQLVHVFDQISENSGVILKYLLFNNAPLSGIDCQIDPELLLISKAHIFLFPLFEQLNRTYEHWRYWGGKIQRKDSDEITFVPNKDRWLENLISVGRARMLRLGYMNRFAHISDETKCYPDSKKLPPSQFRTPEEALDCIFCMEVFSSDNLTEEVAGVSLVEWIRAYSILQQEAHNFIKERKNIRPFSIKEWCIVKSSDDWIKTIVHGGINLKNAHKIVELLTFNKKSRDLFDCPLIPIDGNLVSLPSILSTTSGSTACLSNFSNLGLEIGFKGTGLEKRFRNKLSEIGIKNANIYFNDNNDEYESDIVFVIDGNLYFLECKTIIQPQTSRSHYEFLNKISDASNQLNRVANFYLNHIEIIIQELELPEKWNPQKVHKFIITSAMIGKNIKVNDCIVIDSSIFIRFLDRQPPGLVIGDKIIFGDDNNYIGDITPEKINNLIANPPPIDISKRRYSEKCVTINLPEINYSFINFENIPEIVYLSENKEEELLNSLGINIE